MHMDLDTNMKLIGKRYPYLATYEVLYFLVDIISNNVTSDVA